MAWRMEEQRQRVVREMQSQYTRDKLRADLDYALRCGDKVVSFPDKAFMLEYANEWAEENGCTLEYCGSHNYGMQLYNNLVYRIVVKRVY